MLTSRILSFEELRALVIAAYDRGEYLRESHTTFSHGNIGWDWQGLAKKVDDLVADGEKSRPFLIIRHDVYEKDAAQDVENLIRLQRRVEELGKDVTTYSQARNLAVDELNKIKNMMLELRLLAFEGDLGYTDRQMVIKLHEIVLSYRHQQAEREKRAQKRRKRK